MSNGELDLVDLFVEQCALETAVVDPVAAADLLQLLVVEEVDLLHVLNEVAAKGANQLEELVLLELDLFGQLREELLRRKRCP